MRKIITILLIIISFNSYSQKEINLSNKDLTEFIYNDTMKDVTYLDLSSNFLQDVKIDSMKNLVYIAQMFGVENDQKGLELIYKNLSNEQKKEVLDDVSKNYPGYLKLVKGDSK
jgi:hypothetical protein